MVKRLEKLIKHGHRADALLYPGGSEGKGDACGGDEQDRPLRDRGVSRLRIAETFTSRQGEGQLTGVPSFFIRTSGCNLRCWFCDTPYASWTPEGSRLSVAELVDLARQAFWVDPLGEASTGAIESVRHVVLTGGEPLVAAGIVELATAIRDIGIHVTIETAGTVDVEIPCDLLSLSPKLSGSTPAADQHPQWAKTHAERRLPIATMRNLINRSPAVQVKFVVDAVDEFDEIMDVVEQLRITSDDVWIMPQGVSVEQLDAAAEWLRPWTAHQGFQYCERMQIRWYGNRRGT